MTDLSLLLLLENNVALRLPNLTWVIKLEKVLEQTVGDVSSKITAAAVRQHVTVWCFVHELLMMRSLLYPHQSAACLSAQSKSPMC